MHSRSEIRTVGLGLLAASAFGGRSRVTTMAVIAVSVAGSVVAGYLAWWLVAQPGTQHDPILVDSCGADPHDDFPDSTAIQQCIDSALAGDTVLFTSPLAVGYRGYMIDKTLFLVSLSPHVGNNLTFASTDPGTPALLQATAELRGWVISLYPGPDVDAGGRIDNIVLRNLVIDGGRDRRIVVGPDGAGGVFLNGREDWSDETQDYRANPNGWSTGIAVEDLVIRNVETGTALSFSGAAGAIRSTVIDTAGEHVHVEGCAQEDPDEDLDWADGITFSGPDHLVSGNVVYDASDVGIVFFGGKNTVISANVVVARDGNHGMFAGIAIHPWIFGDISGLQVVGNRVEGEADSTCGGIHAGINIGPHMWGAGCFGNAHESSVGVAGGCSGEPGPPKGRLCTEAQLCQVWAYVAFGSTLTLRGNFVSGAQVNFLIGGVDLVGALVDEDNTSEAPRDTDWQSAVGCTSGEFTDSWETHDFVAHSPSLPGWTDIRIHCER